MRKWALVAVLQSLLVAVLQSLPVAAAGASEAHPEFVSAYSVESLGRALEGYEAGRLVRLEGDELPHRARVRMPADAPSILSDYHATRGITGELRAAVNLGNAVIRGAESIHLGIDIEAPRGYPVIAAADGLADIHERRIGGNIVVLVHGEGSLTYSSLYAHLDAIYVQGGQSVVRGELIGAVGNSGAGGTEITHLHFETSNCCALVNPHVRWYGGPGKVTLFSPDRNFTGKPLKLTYPLPGLNDWQRYLAVQSLPEREPGRRDR